MRHIYLDCDGVLADFDRGYSELIQPGPKPDDDELWARVTEYGSFFRDLPSMPRANELVAVVRSMGYRPTVLTGVPKSVPGAAEQKREWIAERWPYMPVITCASRDKSLYGNPGDILIDDRPKYKHLWIQSGKIWITFESAEQAVSELIDVLYDRS